MSWRRVVLLSLGFVLALCCVTWAVLQHSDAATVVVRRKLQETFAPASEVASTELDLANGRLIVRGLQVDCPTRPGATLLAAERIDIDIEANPFEGFFAPHRVAITGLVLDLGTDLPTLEQLLKGGRGEGSGGADSPMPAISISRSRLRATVAAGRPPFELVDVTLQGLPASEVRDHLAVTGHGMLPGLDTRVSVEGSIASSGVIDLIISLAECDLDEAATRWLRQRLALDLEGVEATGKVHDFDIRVTSAANGDDTGVSVAVRGHLDDVRVAAENLPRHIRSADLNFVATNRRGGEVVIRLNQASEQGDIDVTAEITHLSTEPSFSLRAIGEDLAIDDDMVAALRLVPVGKRVIEALQPTAGRADIDLYLRNPQLRTGIAEFDMDLRAVAMAYHGFGTKERRIGFPLPLTEARGRVRLRNDIVLLEELTARIDPAVGGGDVELTGRIDTPAESGEDTTLDLTITDVAFTDELRSCVGNLLGDNGDLYDRLQPRGRANVAVKIRPVSLLPAGWSVTIEPQGSTVTWTGFPYRLDQLRGSIEAGQEGVDFALQGVHGDGSIELNGHIPITADSSDLEVSMQLEKLQIDDELRRAVIVRAPAIDGHWRSCRPTGTCSGRVRAWRESATGPFELDLHIDVNGVDLRLPAHPWHARSLSGKLLITGSGDRARIDFDALRGRLEHNDGNPAELAMLGSVLCGEATESDLSLVVRGLELDDQLGATLEELQALGAGVWQHLQPSGSVDLVCQHKLLADGDDRIELVVHLLDVGSDAAILPRPARKMTGELRLAEERLTWQELVADLDGHLVRCYDGAISSSGATDDRTRIAFKVAAADFPLDQGLANLFAGPLHETIAEREMSGSADVDELSLLFSVPPADSSQPFETVLSGQLRLQDVGLRLGAGSNGIRVEGIYGNIRLDESRIGASGGSLTGAMDEGGLRIFDQSFESIATLFFADADRISLDQLEARLHGGIVTKGTADRPAFDYLLRLDEAPEGRLSANLTYEGIDVRSFLLETGQQNPAYRGAARGHFDLARLDGQDIVDAEGSGSLAISRGDLGVVPLFTAIYSVLPAPERPRFDELDVTFRLANRRVTFDSLKLSSNLLGASGSGTLDLDGYLDVRLTLENLLGNAADPVFMPLIEWFLTQNIVRFHLYGHLRNIKAEERWLTESSPVRPPAPPMPPRMIRRKSADY